MTTRFLPLAPAHRIKVLELMRAYADEDGQSFSLANATAAVDAILADTPLASLWLVELDGEIAGYLCVTQGFSLETGGGDFFLDEIYLVPTARGRGLGHEAIAFAERESQAAGARRLCLEVEPDNRRAAKLYGELGYRSHGRHLMSKPLRHDG